MDNNHIGDPNYTEVNYIKSTKDYIEPIIFCNDKERYITRVMTKMNFKEMRKMKRLTKKALSEITGLSTKCISDIENPYGGNPTYNSIIRYINALGYDIQFTEVI